jgi:hypothetical protein
VTRLGKLGDGFFGYFWKFHKPHIFGETFFRENDARILTKKMCGLHFGPFFLTNSSGHPDHEVSSFVVDLLKISDHSLWRYILCGSTNNWVC